MGDTEKRPTRTPDLAGHTKSGKWCAQIRHDGIVYNLGTYADFDEACRVRDEEELKRFGEYSRLAANAELRTSGGLT